MKRLSVTLMLLAAAILAPTPSAHAQFGGLPPDLVSSDNPDEGVMRKHVEKWLPDVAGGEADKVKKARTELVGFAMANGAVTVPFRQRYSRILVDNHLADLIKSDQDIVAVNALRIAGDVAETAMLELIEPKLAAERQSVRYAAVAAVGRMFEQAAAANSSPAVTADRMVAMINTLGKQYTTEKDQLVADAVARAMVSATGVDKKTFESVRPAAVSKLAEVVGARLKTLEVRAEDSQLLDTSIRVGTLLTDLLNGGQPGGLSAAAQKDAAAFGGDLIAWVVRQINANKLPFDNKQQRTVAGALLTAGEKIIAYAAKSQGVAGAAETNLKGQFDLGTKFGDAQVTVDAKDLIGPSGTLSKPPFNIDVKRYQPAK